MKERPILMSAPMVLATLEDRKSQTRRLVNQLLRFGVVTEFGRSDTPGYDWTFRDKRMCWNDLKHTELLTYCPYGRPGDRLWVRESFQPLFADGEPSEDMDYKTGVGYKVGYVATDGIQEFHDHNTDEISQRITPSIFMPRWASRIQLEILAVEIQRLQDIGGILDVAAEGCSFPAMMRNGDSSVRIAREDVFRPLWDGINGKRPGAAWADNPWVWKVTFRRIKS